MVILRTQNKITNFLMILAWASPFKVHFSQFVFRKMGHQDNPPPWCLPDLPPHRINLCRPTCRHMYAFVRNDYAYSDNIFTAERYRAIAW